MQLKVTHFLIVTSHDQTLLALSSLNQVLCMASQTRQK